MNRWARAGVMVLVLLGSACATLSPAERDRAQAIAVAARTAELSCDQPDACAASSPVRDLAGQALAASTPDDPTHYLVILDGGEDAMLARLDLIRSATSSIELQTYIFDQDDAGNLFLEELLAAARRGVRVRVLIDQLSALEEVEMLAALAGAHRNFELRVYNPTFGRARPNYVHYAMSVLCCFRAFNQRMHGKLLLVDGAVGITGGRNYQDDYYDWDPDYNFRDRDVLVAGPEVRAMWRNFEAFWNDPRSVPAARLTDVGGHLLAHGVPPVELGRYERPERAAAAKAKAGDDALLRERVAGRAMRVGAVHYVADLPAKHREGPDEPGGDDASRMLRDLIESAEDEVLLQTPYLVLSDAASEMFEALHDRPDAPRVIVSTNSLAATDAFMVYALSHKYKRTFLRDYGFHIYEYKPFPGDAPIDIALTGAAEQPAEAPPLVETARVERGRALRRRLRTETRPSFLASGAVTEPVRLKRAGLRIGLHAKSLVVDERVGVVGTHNFDPRSDHYNTEGMLVVPDAAFATALADSIRRDIAPENSWVIDRRPRPPVLSGLDYSLGKLFEQLPLFDLWPLRYATSYEFVPGPTCPEPIPPGDPGFHDCHVPVGDFPEVAIGPKWLYTRILMAFGAGLAPVL